MISVKNLAVNRKNKNILKDINFMLKPGEVSVILGPNGSGKSTLANIIMGSPLLKVTGGSILFEKKDITNLSVEERSKLGIFLAFQYPGEVEGVSLMQFLKLIYEEHHKKIPLFEFSKKVEDICKKINFDTKLLQRGLNVGFSGGEKKKCEVLQAALINPKVLILDETDSGLDVTSLKNVASAVKDVKEVSNCSVLVITHYPQFLKYLKPDSAHIVKGGRLVASGKSEIIKKVEKSGFESF